MDWNAEKIKEEVYKVMQILNIDRMPTSQEIRSIGVPGLENAISKNGGFIEIANNLRLNTKKPMTKWNDDIISNKLKAIIEESGIDRMPSASEINKTEKGYELHNAIARTYGYYGWAEKLNLEIKDSETLLGQKFQQICSEELTYRGYQVKNTSIKAPYDLLVNDNVRIDVKSGCAYDMKGSRVHTFGINKNFPTCDIYVIYALDETGENIERTFVIPAKELKIMSMSIGRNSKYNKYINRWDFIDRYDQFYKSSFFL